MPRPAGSLNALLNGPARPDLERLSLAEMTAEMVARLGAGAVYGRDSDLVVAAQLHDLLESCLDVHLNRFSCRRLYDVVRPVLDDISLDQVRDRTVVDLGSGSLNPLAVAFVFLALGARNAYSIDLEPMQDEAWALRALTSVAGWMLVDAARVVGDHAPPPMDVLQHLAGFDFSRLKAGDPGGLDAARLRHRVESVDELSLDDGEAALVTSVSLLEHVEDVAAVMASLRRITAPDGIGHHVVDFVDHRTYGGEVVSPFAFLSVDSDAALVHGSNRLRCRQLCTLFERSGFAIDKVVPIRTESLSAEEHAGFVEPYRSMRRGELELLCARVVVRRI